MLLLPLRCHHVGAAPSLLGSDRWLIPHESGLCCSLAAELGLLSQVEGCHGLVQVFVPAFVPWLPFKGENYLKSRSPKAFSNLARWHMEKKELLSSPSLLISC